MIIGPPGFSESARAELSPHVDAGHDLPPADFYGYAGLQRVDWNQ
jgi:hypothetical protein